MVVQFGYPSWLNSVSSETNLKYTYLSTVQEEKQIAYQTIAPCLHLLQEKNEAVTIYLNYSQYA